MNAREKDDYIDGVQGIIDDLYVENPSSPFILELGDDIRRLKAAGSIEFEAIYEEVHRKIFDELHFVL
jgi:hypothetical protein